MNKKWLSILLMFCMVLCFIPTAAFAAESSNFEATNEARIAETAYATLAEAVNKAKDGETVTLLKDVTVSNTITIGKLITIDGNNHTITAGSNTSAGEMGFVLFKVKADNSKGGTNNSVTIKNCKFEIPGNDATNAWAAILVERGTLSGLTIQNNSFNIEKTSRVPGKGVFQCVGLAYMPEDRVTTNITITGNTVTANGTPDMSDLTASTVNFVVGGTNHPDHGDGYAIGDYSIQNLYVTNNKLDGTNLVGVDVSNVNGLTVTGNTFNCLAAFRLATDTNKKTAEGQKQNTNISINSNTLGENFYDYCMLYLSGNLPMTTDQTLSFPHVKYEQILMDEDATHANTFVKVGFDANGGKFTFENTSGCEFAARVMAQSTNGTQIDLPTPIRDDWNFDGWKAEIGTSSAQMDKDAKNYTVTDSVKFVAQWSQPTTYTVTYTDGRGGLWFKDDVHEDLTAGTQTPGYTDGTPSHDGYDFLGWTPAVADTVTGNITYTAQWESKSEKLIKELLGKIKVECINTSSGHKAAEYDTSVGGYSAVTLEGEKGKFTSTITVEAAKYVERYNEDTAVTHRLADGGETATRTIVVEFDSSYATANVTVTSGTLPVVFQVTCAEPDPQPDQKYTVTYTDGVDGEEIFMDQVTGNLKFGDQTPAFNGTPTRDGYKFTGWTPKVAETVTGNATYTAQWEKLTSPTPWYPPTQTEYDLTITKKVEGLDSIPANYVVTVTITGKNGTSKTMSLRANETQSIKLPVGEYTLTETAPAVEGYTQSAQTFSTNHFTLAYGGKNVTITNSYTKDAEEPAVDPDQPTKPEKPSKPTKPAKTNDNPNEVPKTGDNSHVLLWFALLLVSGGAAIGTTVVTKKKTYHR